MITALHSQSPDGRPDAGRSPRGTAPPATVITSAADGAHSGPADPHHTGEAFDLRTRDLSAAQKSLLLHDLQAGLYRDPRQFYAFLEAPETPNEHIHCQRRNGVTYTMLDYLREV